MAAIQLVSDVLVLLGRDPISSISDDPDAPKVNAIVDRKTAFILQDFNWTFAIRYQELAQSTTSSNPQFTYEYPFTPEVSRVLEVYKPYTDTNSVTRINRPLPLDQYVTQNTSIFTNVDRILIEFITKNVEIPTQNAAVKEMILYLSASEGALVLNENEKQSNDFEMKYEEYKRYGRMNGIQAGRQRNWRITRRVY